ncbi:hypothetical protein MCOR17_011759, partial [Pyricularia oryzae]
MAGTHGKLHAVDRALVRCHGTFFTGKGTEDLEDARNEFLSNLDKHPPPFMGQTHL